MKNKQVLIDMIAIYKTRKRDWMGYEISKRNFYSYHHIDERRNGGLETVDNGAILTKDSHRILHILEQYNFDLYLEWQVLFLEINESRKPLDDYFYGKIAELNKKTKEFIKFLSDEKSNNRSITL